MGKFPWGTSKKDREKSRKLASSSSVQEPLPAGTRKREHANSPASMPPVLPSGPLVIDLLDVKEEEVEECFHSLVDHNDQSWFYYRDLPAALWHGNEMTGDGRVMEFIQSLDSTLFQYNMRGWDGMQNHIRAHAESFKFFRMNTASHRGFMIICKNCTKLCKISWAKKLSWDDDVLETNRVQLRDFLGFGTRSAVKRQRMV